MVNSITNALNAYQQALGRINGQTGQIAAPEQAKPAAGFGEMVKSAIENTVDAQNQAEKVTIAGIQGKADIQDVVLAVANAETALETVVAVRDTAIKAYNTIMQMPM